jgi:ribonuclease D
MYPETISAELIEQLPLAIFEGEIVEVKTYREAVHALQELAQEKLLGFDTETRPSFTPQQAQQHKTALLQLSSHNKAFLFRLPWCGLSKRLVALLSDPNVLKVGVAVKDDIRGLQAYRAFKPAGFVDLQMLTESLGIKEKSVKKVAAIVLNLRVSKGQQLSNWEHYDLSPAQCQYAALDAWICREIYLKLRNEYDFPKR